MIHKITHLITVSQDVTWVKTSILHSYCKLFLVQIITGYIQKTEAPNLITHSSMLKIKIIIRSQNFR